MKTIELGVSVLCFVSMLGACGGDDTTPPVVMIDGSVSDVADAGQDVGGDVGEDVGQDVGQDVAPGETVNGCDDAAFAANDHTADLDARLITFPNNASPSQYSPNCMRIKVGQMVTWQGDFASHPLNTSGGDANSPIVRTDSGTAQAFTFANAGTFGFHCEVHPTIMFGAIRVVP